MKRIKYAAKIFVAHPIEFSNFTLILTRSLVSSVCLIKESFPFSDSRSFRIEDPFDPDPDVHVDHRLKDSWGAMKWIAMADIDLDSGWLLRKGKNFRGYPFKASIFRRYPTMIQSNTLLKSFLNSQYANGAKYSGGFAGFDGLVLGNLAQIYNFQTIRVTSESYGTLLPEKIFSGCYMNRTLLLFDETIKENVFKVHWGTCSIAVPT